MEWDFVVHRIGVVREGVLYRSKTLGADTLDEVVAERGVRTIVNLRKDDVAADREVAAARGARYVWLPSSQVPEEHVVRSFLEVMRDPANHPVLLHCEHGVGRTGVLSGVYRLEFECASIEDVLEEARHYAFQDSFEPGTPKAVFLEDYARRLRERRSASTTEPGRGDAPGG
jgi:protein tyrosine/serine phosphatase